MSHQMESSENLSNTKFVPPFWLRNPHLQTLWGKFCRKRVTVPIEKVRWDTPDGDFLDLYRLQQQADWNRIDNVEHRLSADRSYPDVIDRSDPDMVHKAKPHIVILHGLEGTIRSHYVNGLFQKCESLGWSADLLIFRSCGDELNRTERFYHSGETQDLRFVLENLIAEDADRPIALIGVSLGGNVLLKYLGESGDDTPQQIISAAAVSVPYDLGKGSRFISNGFSRVYEKNFIGSLKSKVAAKLVNLPTMNVNSNWNEAVTLYDFDNTVTAPLHGFVDADDYYSRSSAIGYLQNIRPSTLLLSAYDDPFLPPSVLDEVKMICKQNPAITVEFHDHGGHVGFVANSSLFSPRYYMEDRVCEFIKSVSYSARET